jgi:hypothetical protein
MRQVCDPAPSLTIGAGAVWAAAACAFVGYALVAAWGAIRRASREKTPSALSVVPCEAKEGDDCRCTPDDDPNDIGPVTYGDGHEENRTRTAGIQKECTDLRDDRDTNTTTVIPLWNPTASWGAPQRRVPTDTWPWGASGGRDEDDGWSSACAHPSVPLVDAPLHESWAPAYSADPMNAGP